MSEREYKALRSVPASTWMEGFCVTKQMEEGNDKLAEKGWRPVNVDATLIAQQPKLAPHAAAMVANVAADLGIGVDAVNIKGKTNEKLGYLGRQEAIEAQAVVLVERVG